MDLEPATWQLPRWDRVERWPRVSAAHMARVGCLRPSDGLDGWAAAESLGQRIEVGYDPEDRSALVVARVWKKAQPVEAAEDGGEVESAATLEEAEETAWTEIRNSSALACSTTIGGFPDGIFPNAPI